MSREQLQFLADTFLAAPEGWHVAVMQHIQAPHILGCWRRFLEPSSMKREMIFMQIVDDFAHHRGDLVQGFHNPPITGEYDKIKWDFSNAKASFVGAFFGHTHLERHMNIDGVNWTTRPGYGTTPRDCIVMGARCPKIELKFNRSRDMMIDLVAVKPAKRAVHVFRFGCGGPKSELAFTY